MTYYKNVDGEWVQCDVSELQAGDYYKMVSRSGGELISYWSE